VYKTKRIVNWYCLFMYIWCRQGEKKPWNELLG